MPSPTSIRVRGLSVWTAATAGRPYRPTHPAPLADSRPGDAIPVPTSSRLRRSHFRDWPAAARIVGELGFPDDAKDWPIARLPTGERLRLALVCALMVRPKVLLLDEPTAALDPASVRAVETLASMRIRAGLGVLWVTHDTEQAGRMALRRLVVSNGQVREEGSECPAISR